MNLDRKQYIDKCKERWHGVHLADAAQNWFGFEKIKTDLTEAMKEYKRNPGQKDLTGKYHNPDYTLTNFLWKLQSTLQPDKGRLDPLIDFEEHFQKCFLRRGLIIFLLNDSPRTGNRKAESRSVRFKLRFRSFKGGFMKQQNKDLIISVVVAMAMMFALGGLVRYGEMLRHKASVEERKALGPTNSETENVWMQIENELPIVTSATNLWHRPEIIETNGYWIVRFSRREFETHLPTH